MSSHKLARLLFPCLAVAVLFFVCASSARATQVVLRPSDGVARALTLQDACKYTQMSIDVTNEFFGAFSRSLPDAAGNIKNMLTVVILWEQARDIDKDPKAFQRVFKSLVDLAIEFGATQWDKACGTSYAKILGLWGLYKDSLAALHDWVFIPGLTDMAYEWYRAARNGGADHTGAMNQISIPEPVIANAVVQVILPKHGVQPGVMKGISFDDKTLAQLDKSVSGAAAGRTIIVTHKPKLTLSGDRPFSLNRDLSERIEVLAPRVDNWQDWLPDLQYDITQRDLSQRQDADYPGYRPLTASDEKAVEAELRLLLEKLRALDMGPRIRQEAMDYIATVLRLRYDQEVSKAAMEQAARAAQAQLKKDMEALAAYAWPKLIQVNTVNQAGETVPVSGAAIFVDGRLCTRETNGDKPCGTNKYGLAGVHLPLGGHDLIVRAPGFREQEIYITAHVPDQTDGAKPRPEDFEVVLVPEPFAADVAVRVLDATEQPLAGATVTLGELSQATGADGTALFRDVPPSPEGGYAVSASKQGLPTARDTLVVALAEPGRTVAMDLVLASGGAVLVAVRDDQNHLVPEATVIVSGYTQQFEKQAGPGNMLHFQGVPPGDYMVGATAPGHIPTQGQQITVTESGPAPTVRLTLVAGMWLSVTIADDQGRQGYPGEVALDGEWYEADYGMAGFPVREGLHSITVRVEDGREATVQYKAEPLKMERDMLTVMLPPPTGNALQVRVFNGEDGAPLEGAALVLKNEQGTVAQGQGPEHTFSGLSAGRYQVAAQADGFLPRESPWVEVPFPEAEKVVRLGMEPGTTVRDWSYGSFADRDGQRVFSAPKLNGNSLIEEMSAPVAFCQAQELRPLLPQPSGSVADLPGPLVNHNGAEVCATASAGGTDKSCPGFRTITCGLGPPCPPDDPECGMDMDAMLADVPSRELMATIMPDPALLPLPAVCDQEAGWSVEVLPPSEDFQGQPLNDLGWKYTCQAPSGPKDLTIMVLGGSPVMIEMMYLLETGFLEWAHDEPFHMDESGGWAVLAPVPQMTPFKAGRKGCVIWPTTAETPGTVMFYKRHYQVHVAHPMTPDGLDIGKQAAHLVEDNIR